MMIAIENQTQKRLGIIYIVYPFNARILGRT